MFGDTVQSLVIGAGAAIGMYVAYGTPQLKAQAGQRRLQMSAMVGVIVAIIVFVIFYLNLV